MENENRNENIVMNPKNSKSKKSQKSQKVEPDAATEQKI
jgi:hypothetical protein